MACGGLRRSMSSPMTVCRPSPGLSLANRLDVFAQNDTGSMQKRPSDNFRSPLENLDKVLFLDIDGVLHTVAVTHPRQQFDRRCMNYLCEIIAKTDATIVLSTAWRADPEARRMIADKLQEYGLPLFVSRTPQIAMFRRTKELMAWVRKYRPKTWVSIDDLPLGEEDPDNMRGHFVQTRARFGLQQDTASATIELFRQQQMRLLSAEGETSDPVPRPMSATSLPGPCVRA